MNEQTQHGMAPVLKPAQQQNQNPVQRLSAAIAQRRPAFADVATKFLDPDRLVKLAQVCIAKNPALADCSTLSVLDCLMTCARLGLEPNEPGGLWLVPFKGVCTGVIDYRGLIDVCRRSGNIAAVHADARHQNDLWEYRIDTQGSTLVTLRHAPAEGDRGPMVGAFFVAKLTGGECQAVYLSKDQIDGFRARSKADQKGFSPWKSDYLAMAIKTACRRGVNLLPKTREVQMLREELQKEDVIDVLPVLGEGGEDTQEAIDRLLTEAEAQADAIQAGFKALGFGPARQLQALMKYHGDPQALVDWLAGQQQPQNTTQAPAANTTQPVELAAANVTQAEPAPVKKGKGGRPKKAAPAPAPAAPATRTFDGGSF